VAEPRPTDPPRRAPGSERFLLGKLYVDAVPRATRSLREFAEAELVLPEGPYRGQRFRVRRQPFTGPLLDLISSGRYSTIAVTGATQSGKTLVAFVIPVLYHLFELRETVVVGVPDLGMAADKWQQDLRPAIEAAPRFRALLPTTGSGARGGRNLTAIRFGNGATLRFMTSRSSDKAVAGFTTRVVAQTEIDGYAVMGGRSVETDRVSQIDARTMAFRPRHRHYHESTVSTPDGRIWTEYRGGTEHRLCLPCPHCDVYVTPEREHVTGWEDAETEDEARERTRVACPACGARWEEEDRRAANAAVVAAARGQEVTADGTVTGPPPVTATLGYRWSAVNNLLIPIAELGAEEWKAQRASDREAEERKIQQFWCALPARIGPTDLVALDPKALAGRAVTDDHRRGLVPRGHRAFALGVDVGLHLVYWTVVALTGEEGHEGGHVVDYGRIETGAGDVPEDSAVANAILAVRRRAVEGWAQPVHADGSFARAVPSWAWVDAGYKDVAVHAACAAPAPVRGDGETTETAWLPSRGLGWHQTRVGDGGPYHAPQRTSRHVVLIGDRWHLVAAPQLAVGYEARLDADGWKSWLHDRLHLDPRAPGAVTLYRAPNRSDHLSYLRHLTAERQVVVVKPGVGEVRAWTNPTGRQNHWLDATTNAFAAAHFALAWEAAARATAAAVRSVVEGRYDRLPDGRPFLVRRRGA